MKTNVYAGGSVILLLAIFIFSEESVAQKLDLTLSTEITHLTKDSEEWFNAGGIRIGLNYELNKSIQPFINYGKYSSFSGDNSNPEQIFNRGLINYRIVSTGIAFPIIYFKKSHLSIQTGISVRFTQQTRDTFALVEGNESNTNEVFVLTSYDSFRDAGALFGLAYSREITEKITIKLHATATNFGDNITTEEIPTYSMISNGLTFLLRI